MPTALRVLIPYLAATLLGFAAAWWLRATIATNDMLTYQQEVAEAQAEAEENARRLDQEAARNKQQSTDRLDEAEQKVAVEVQYVDRETIRYVTKYRDADCPANPGRDFDWVCLYNRSFGLPCPLSEAGVAGRPSDAGAM